MILHRSKVHRKLSREKCQLQGLKTAAQEAYLWDAVRLHGSALPAGMLRPPSRNTRDDPAETAPTLQAKGARH